MATALCRIFSARCFHLRYPYPALLTTTPGKAWQSNKWRRSKSSATTEKIAAANPPGIFAAARDPNGLEISAQNHKLDFSNPEEAYRSKSTSDLVRALLVFRLCSSKVLVENSKELMKLCRRIFGKHIFIGLMRASFYGHFVAGEDRHSIKPLVDRMNQFGVGSILDYSVEEDISHKDAIEAEMKACIPLNTRETAERNRRYDAHEEFGDRRDDVMSARTYFYQDEEKCDENARQFLHCIETAGAATQDGFAAIKLTALGRPQLLLQLSECLVQTQAKFVEMVGSSENIAKQKINLETFRTNLKEKDIGLRESEEVFTWLDRNEDGLIDLLDWNRMLQPDIKIKDILRIPDKQSGKLEPYITTLNDDEDYSMKKMLKRINHLAERAKEKGVRLMIDAEQTYFQPAISRLAIEVMRKFNRDRPVIFNTYQCYLKEAFNNCTVDLKYARKEGFHFGAKLVRGAYMDQERKRAEEVGYPDPINESYERTNQVYTQVLDHCLQAIRQDSRINIMVASHNQDSVNYTVHRMKELGLKPEDKQVYFGQLLGMCDQITFPLGQAGYSVFKYVPFGPVEEVLPYLSRRALENQGLFTGVKRERLLLWRELKRRLKTSRLF